MNNDYNDDVDDDDTDDDDTDDDNDDDNDDDDVDDDDYDDDYDDDDALPMVWWPLRGGKERLHTCTGCANTNWPNHFRRRRTRYQHAHWMRRWGHINNKKFSSQLGDGLKRWRRLSVRTWN